MYIYLVGGRELEEIPFIVCNNHTLLCTGMNDKIMFFKASELIYFSTR
jgi:hypothetical protein